jgi:uncharacterized protein YbjT (DUF2867 family)
MLSQVAKVGYDCASRVRRGPNCSTVRAAVVLVRESDALGPVSAEALRRLGAEVVEGDLTDLASMHRAIERCGRIYFGMSASPAYLEATMNTAVVARHHGVEAFVNMSPS